ncbi:hypothetical protein [Epilithonimonas vandammei]|uniref:hypothetical protein n=1 Tax=Epilithonimonas vandammei TaxID=2487072 RepID=UPI0028A2AD22|nr:hypothetical protein [Epilithonimonas vandammei]
MKKKLKLGKKSITELNVTKAMVVKGGLLARTDGCGTGITSGCTDGCTPFNTLGNCSNSYCTDNCPGTEGGFSQGGC